MADTKKDIFCPVCKTKMEKIFIEELKINLDICVDGCGGMFFDNREFKHFDEKHEDISPILSAIEGKEFKSYPDVEQRTCPACGNKMVKNFSSINKIIQVDDCYSCGGKFLDNQELIKIRNEYQNDEDRTNDVLQYFYNAYGEEMLKAKIEAENNKPSLGYQLITKIIKKI